MEQSLAYEPRVASAIELIPNVKGRELLPFMRFLLWEYGLIEIVAYLPNPYVLMAAGRDWQIERDTFAAVTRALGWVEQPGSIVEAALRRKWWNSFQLNLAAVPPNDGLALNRIEIVTRLSKPFRSDLRRVVSGYDAPALEADEIRLDGGRADSDSGVRLLPSGPLWSFGSPLEVEHLWTEVEGALVDNWLAPSDGITWEDLSIPWTDANFAWNADPASQRRNVLANWFDERPCYAVLRDADGVVGYRRCKIAGPVSQNYEGFYRFGSLTYSINQNGGRAYAEALTEFGDGAGRTATTVGLAFNVERAVGVKPGRLWLAADDVVSADEVATTAVSLPMRSTVRHHIKFLLRF
jgi:hypothetical protein